MATNIGTRIMERRQKLGLTQEELAFRMGYKTKSAINKIELGINDVSQSKVVKFAEVLHTSVSYLIEDDEAKESSPNELQLSEGEKALIKLLRRAPVADRTIVIEKILSALDNQE